MNMKRSFYILLAAVGALILVLASCNPLLTTLEPAATGAAAGSTSPAPGKGGISIGVQPISPVLMEIIQKMQGQAASKALSPKAYLSAAKVVFTVLKQPDNHFVDSWTVYPTQTGAGNGGWNLGAWYGAPDATYQYILNADVYNQVGDTMPVVQGSQTFWISSASQSPNSYNVTVTCTPSSAVVLTEGVESALTTLPLVWNWNNGYTTVGSEAWFQVTPSTSLTSFKATPAAGSYASLNMVVFDANGNWVASTYSQSDGSTLSIPMCSTTPDVVYYIGLVDWQYSGASNRAFTVSAGPTSLPAATPISTGSWAAGSLLPGDVKVYSFSGVAGKTYAVNWDDAARGSGSQTADVVVSALNPDLSLIFSNADSGWSGSSYYQWGSYFGNGVDDTRIIQGTGSTINLVVSGYSAGSSGTFLIKVAEYNLAVDFESYASGTTDLVANNWAFDNAGFTSTGSAQVVWDPTGWGYGNVLELNDQNQTLSDPGIALYTPFVAALQSANLSSMPTTISLDFYLTGDFGRWFTLAKTYAQAFVMNDPSNDIDAYAGGNHTYLYVNRYQWYRLVLKINDTPGSYSMYLYDRWGYLMSQLNDLAFNAENHDTSHFSAGSGDGRLFFGSYLDDVTGDASYGHVYIDNIRVLQ